MDVELALTLVVLVVLAGVAGCVWNVVRIARRKDHEAADPPPVGWQDRLRSILSDWPKAAAAVVLLSTFVPWISGSAVGVALPETLWELPWVRWAVGLPAVLVTTLVWVTPHRRVAAANAATTASFMACTVVGTAVFLTTVFAESTSRYTFQFDTALRAIGLEEHVLPVVRGGIGAPMYTLAAVAGIFLTTAGYRRRRALPAQAEDPAIGILGAGDDWWK